MADDATPSVAAGGVAPAVAVKGYADRVLDVLYAEEDCVAERQEFFEGRRLTDRELQFRMHVGRTVLDEVNRRLLPHGVVLAACRPESMGFGFEFVGGDRRFAATGGRAGNEYRVKYGLADEVRLNAARLDSADLVREIIDDVHGAIVRRRQELRRAGVAV
jgi:hypothetical protein